jgi:hypothetical protein
MNNYLTIKQAYKMLGYKSSDSLRGAINDHQINGFKLGRDWFVSMAEIKQQKKRRGLTNINFDTVVQ